MDDLKITNEHLDSINKVLKEAAYSADQVVRGLRKAGQALGAVYADLKRGLLVAEARMWIRKNQELREQILSI